MFQQKKDKLLQDLRAIALRHNRDYYESIIPFVESADESSEDLIDTYIAALDENRSTLVHSRKTMDAVGMVEAILN